MHGQVCRLCLVGTTQSRYISLSVHMVLRYMLISQAEIRASWIRESSWAPPVKLKFCRAFVLVPELLRPLTIGLVSPVHTCLSVLKWWILDCFMQGAIGVMTGYRLSVYLPHATLVGVISIKALTKRRQPSCFVFWKMIILITSRWQLESKRSNLYSKMLGTTYSNRSHCRLNPLVSFNSVASYRLLCTLFWDVYHCT